MSSFLRAVWNRSEQSHVGGVPLAQVMVEGSSTHEHTPHVGDLGGVPLAQVLIECCSPLEQVRHVGDAGSTY